LLLPQRMDGWSPTYRAERVKVIGRLINLTPNQNPGRIAHEAVEDFYDARKNYF